MKLKWDATSGCSCHGLAWLILIWNTVMHISLGSKILIQRSRKAHSILLINDSFIYLILVQFIHTLMKLMLQVRDMLLTCATLRGILATGFRRGFLLGRTLTLTCIFLYHGRNRLVNWVVIRIVSEITPHNKWS